MVERALDGTITRFAEIRKNDGKLAKPIIDRDLAVVVALRPDFGGPEEDEILTIAQIGEFDDSDLFELFVLKATYRAFTQQRRGSQTDTAPMEALPWLPDGELHKASSASVNGLHIGLAGGWAHHGRLLAVEFAADLADSLGLAEVAPENEALLEASEAQARLAWLNQGKGSGDNTPTHSTARSQYRFVMDLIAR
jgi:hypothetical protein